MRFIQVGVGGFGQTWLGRLQRDHTASLVALVDLNPQALDSAAAQTRLAASHCFYDYPDALGAVDADAVLIATPPATHHAVALAAFARGLHVLVEKPMADTMEHAELMVKAAEEAGRTLMVSQNYRFRPWARTLKQLIQSGRFGAPDNISVRFARAFRPETPEGKKMPHPLVRDMSIHHFDLLRSVTGREPLSVYGRTWQPPWSWCAEDPCAAAIFEFEGGLKAVYEADWVTRGRETTWDGYWFVECSGAAMELRGESVHVIPAGHPDEDGEVELQPPPAAREEATAAAPHTAAAAVAGQSAARQDSAASPAEVTGQSAVLQEFQAAIVEGREPETGARDNLKSLAMCFALLESSRTGRPVEFPPPKG